MTYFPATNPSRWAPKPATLEQAARVEGLLQAILDGEVILPVPTGEFVAAVARNSGLTDPAEVFRAAGRAIRADGHGDLARDLADLVREARAGTAV